MLREELYAAGLSPATMCFLTPVLPTGTVTLLFSDVAGSTELVKLLGERYADVLAEHRRLLREAFAEHGGVEVDTQGDSFFVAFARARDAVAAAIAAQRALAAHAWPEGAELRVRLGLHTCEPHRSHEGYVGVGVHRAARICTVAHGGQTLLSRSTAGIFADEQLEGVGLRDLGEHRLKDIERPEHVSQLVVDGLPADFPALRTLDQQPPLSGTVAVVMVEGRRMMRLFRELSTEAFGGLISDYQWLLRDVLSHAGGRDVEVTQDTAVAAFPTARRAALAAVAARDAVAAHEWPHGRSVAVSIGVHAGAAAIGWIGPAVLRCEALCDAAEGGEILVSPAVGALLEEDEELPGLLVRDVCERRTRRGGRTVRAAELAARGNAH